MISAITAVLGLAVFVPGFYLLGSMIERLLKEQHPGLRGIYYIAMGMGMFVYYLILIGSFSMLTLRPVLGFLVVVFVLRKEKFPEFKNWLFSWFSYFAEKGTLVKRISQLVFGLTALLTFALCFVPETGNDALCYQLNIPKTFIRQHSVWPFFYDFNTYMPVLMNVLYSAALLLKSVALAKLFHWMTGMLLCLGLLVYIDQETKRRTLAWFCALMMWLTPTLFNQITSANIDIGLTFFFFLFAISFFRARQEGAAGLFLLSGLFYGFAVSIKFLILISGLPVAVFFLYDAFRLRFKILRPFLIFTAGVFLGCGFWFIRNLILTGNPAYPYLDWLFGTKGLSNFQVYWNLGMPKTLLNFILIPWNVTFFPEHFDKGHWAGPFYALTVPVIALAFVKRPPVRPFVIFTALYAIGWFVVAQLVRYLMPVMPLVLIAAAGGFTIFQIWIHQKIMRALASAAAVLIIAFLLALNLYHYRYQYLPLIGRWSGDVYLSKMERTYPTAQWVNLNLPEDANIIDVGETRQFYFDRTMVREHMLNLLRDDPSQPYSGAVDYFKKLGFTHILRAHLMGKEEMPGSRLFEMDKELTTSLEIKKLYEGRSANIREDQYFYTVYKIK